MSDQAAAGREFSESTPTAERAHDVGPEPSRRRRLWLYWLVGVGTFVVGGLIALFVIGVISDAGEMAGQHPATLETPDVVAGLERSNDPEFQAVADQLASDTVASTGVDAEQVMATYYTDPASIEKLVMIAGLTAALSEPADELDYFLNGVAEGHGLSGEIEVDPGPMGGLVRCGETTLAGLPVSVCGWADHGSIVVGFFTNRDIDESSDLLLQIREKILVRY